MTRNEIGCKYAGCRIYALVRRMGGKGHDIDCGTVYEIRPNGALRYVREIMGCIANKGQVAQWERLTGGHYTVGRPTAERIATQIDKLVE